VSRCRLETNVSAFVRAAHGHGALQPILFSVSRWPSIRGRDAGVLFGNGHRAGHNQRASTTRVGLDLFDRHYLSGWMLADTHLMSHLNRRGGAASWHLL
jgi:hypothetical protein